MLASVVLKKTGWGPMVWPKGGNRPEGLAYTGRRVSSLVPWGDSEESETVEVSQDVVNRHEEGSWEGEGVREGAGEGGGEGDGEGEGEGEGDGEGEGEGGGEGEGEGAREKAREKARGKGREEEREKVKGKKVEKTEKGGRRG
jgi:hypothetical protein